MLITLELLKRKYPIEITGIVHVGAHFGEEAADYERHGVTNVHWFEANEDLIPVITRKVPDSHKVIHALVSDTDGQTLELNVTNNEQGMSSSVLPLGTHAIVAPQVKYVERKSVRSRTLDSLVAEHGIADVNWLGMDVQGYEDRVLNGAEKLLGSIEWIFCEINLDELYQGCCRLPWLDGWLAERGFIRVETSFAENLVGWGDALYWRYPGTFRP